MSARDDLPDGRLAQGLWLLLALRRPARGIGAATYKALLDAGHRVAGQSTMGENGLIAADFTDHDDRLGIGVILEQGQGLDKICAHHGVTAVPRRTGLVGSLTSTTCR